MWPKMGKAGQWSTCCSGVTYTAQLGPVAWSALSVSSAATAWPLQSSVLNLIYYNAKSPAHLCIAAGSGDQRTVANEHVSENVKAVKAHVISVALIATAIASSSQSISTHSSHSATFMMNKGSNCSLQVGRLGSLLLLVACPTL
jgi:hypothetical protein